MKIEPHNFMFIFVSVFIPWCYFNTYIVINDKDIDIKRFFCRNDGFYKDTATFNADDVCDIGFPKDFGIQLIENIIIRRGDSFYEEFD